MASLIGPLLLWASISCAVVAGAPVGTTTEIAETTEIQNVTSNSTLESTIAPTTTVDFATTTTNPSQEKGFCERYGLERGCLWKTGAGTAVLLVYAAIVFAFILVGCTDRGLCVVIK